MQLVEIIRKDGEYDTIEVYDITDFPYERLNKKKVKLRQKHGRKGGYVCTFGTFDIETTTIVNENYKTWANNGKRKSLDREDAPTGFMYHWQMCVGGYVCTGRRWEEWLEFMKRLKDALEYSGEFRFVCYVHNLGYEFQFMRNFLEKYFGGYSIFASQPRKPIKVTTNNGVEFRCSYKNTNMSLEKATENELGVVHIKASGDLDYKKIRTADTPLDAKELGYCVSDVVGLYEVIRCRMKNEKDSLESIPLTSTGYVRRDCRKACRHYEHYRDKYFYKNRMSVEIYTMLKEAGRGGNTHANRYMSGRVWHNADSFDEVSGYPAMQLLKKFPMTGFSYYGEVEKRSELNELLDKYACLFHVVYENLRVKDDIPMPYVSTAKALQFTIKDCRLDNGRFLSVGAVALCVTDIDFKIIELEYEYDSIAISDFYIARYDYLPEPLRDTIKSYFVQKCELKHKIKTNDGDKEALENDQYLYGKVKNRLNGIFGMTYSDPVRNTITLDEGTGKWQESRPDDIEFELEKYYRSRNNFLAYSWGVWTTALNREHLEKLLQITSSYGIGSGSSGVCLYCDTDSSKAINVDYDLIDKANKEIIEECERLGAYCDVGGERFYIGLYEKENKEPIKEFKTLGAKKYAYVDDSGLHTTISGVNKKLAPKEMGSIDNFVPGFIFREAGGSTLYYNDSPTGIYTIEVDGCKMTTASNIGMVDSTYELGITDEYAELIGLNFLDV